MAIETIDFEVLWKDRNFELRKYREYITASIEIEADFNEALNSGFRILFDYFSGNNWSKNPIYITGPVQGQKTRREKINMTTPMTVTKVDEGSKYIISFIVPSKYSGDNLPEPFNKHIIFQKVKPYTAAIMMFRGHINDVIAK